MFQKEHFAKRLALVVDDEPFSVKILSRQMREIGFGSVYTAANGKEALELLTNPTLPDFDCVIADFNMPEMNGLELLRLIRTGRGGMRRDMPAMMLTGISDQKLVGSAIALDVDAFILKPSEFLAMQERVHRAFSHRAKPKSRTEYAAVKVTFPEIPCQPAPQPLPEEEKKGPVTALNDVKPGDVISHEVKTASGITILPKGTKLTPRLINGLKDLASLAEAVNELRVTSGDDD